MADFAPALIKTLRHEGGFYQAPKTGEVAQRGITIWTLRSLGYLPDAPPTQPASDFEIAFVKNLDMLTTEKIYRQQYWDINRLGEIVSQPLAEKVFGLGVNCGPGTAVMWLQHAVNVMEFPGGIVEDGKVGRKTLAAVNSLDDAELLLLVRQQAEKHYRVLAENPKHAGDLRGWLTRLAEG